VHKTGSAIVSIDTTGSGRDSLSFTAKVWVDASYEGDLFARAGVTYTVGREAKATYNESLAGMSAGSRSHQFNLPVNPFGSDGRALPLTQLPAAGAVVGGGDKMVQSYNFRLCVTKNTSNMVPFPKPTNYSAATFELLRQYINACEGKYSPHDSVITGRIAKGHCQLGFPSCSTASVPGAKYDSNNCGGISSDFIGGSWNYPDAGYSERQTIWKAHMDYQQGILWTMANDPQIPASVRNAMAQWGLCKDEFADNTLSPHWPPSLYVRAARRLQGDMVFTQNTPKKQRAGGIGNLSIGLGGYNFDSHNAQRLACHNASACYGTGPTGRMAGTPFAWNEGNVEIDPGVYQIPMWVTLPRKAEASNLLVVAAPSASHIGMSTLRMEPQFMIIGHAAGAIAALAINTSGAHTSVHDIDPSVLRSVLIRGGMKLDDHSSTPSSTII